MSETCYHFVDIHFHDINSERKSKTEISNRVMSSMNRIAMPLQLWPMPGRQAIGRHSADSVGTKLTDCWSTLGRHRQMLDRT